MAQVFARTDMDEKDELRQFLIVLRQALLLIVSWIEKRYNLKQPTAK